MLKPRRRETGLLHKLDTLEPLGTKIERDTRQWMHWARGVKIFWRYLALLSVLWFVLVHYYERTVVGRTLGQCKWEPTPWPAGATPHRVAMLADPQIMDEHSYPGRPWIINWVTQQFLDNYHRKNWMYIHAKLNPDSVFFLGDMFDGGREQDQDHWTKEYRRFMKIFEPRPEILTVTSLAGNHDIGFGDSVVESSLHLFTAYFGEPSKAVKVGNHTFVLLDTISLSNNLNPGISALPKAFLESFDVRNQEYPRILLTHVPLWRNVQEQTCTGPRESKIPFPAMYGYQYKTLIDSTLTDAILSRIQPEIVFSGDDHDYCQIKHAYQANGKSKNTEEITVKSCAMNMNIKKPAIQLLSLYNPGELIQDPDDPTANLKTYKTEICYLPNPYKPLKVYTFFYIVSLAVLIWMNIYPSSFNARIGFKLGRWMGDSVNPLLPISSKQTVKEHKTVLQSTRFAITSNGGILTVVANATVMTVLVFSILSYHYTSI
ncbi:AaceriAGL131Wp [[Ashbya] aceris (nom. inval.)]|nr:AaceriAGL131Wp [[Ashbya] aceris (nom. inval.)]